LPAIGVVKFPMANTASLSGTPAGLPVSATGLSDSARGLPPANLPATTLGGDAPDAASQELSLLGPPWTKQKLGLSAWVFLAPVMLLGLGLWTFAPNRRGLGR
jgi:hypothetical protein